MNSSIYPYRSGFTVVDMAFASVLTTVLAGILLPTIQHAREDNLKLECQQRLMRIGVASIEYDEVNEHLPPYLAHPIESIFPNDPPRYQYTYSLVQLLEFFGEDKLASQIDPFAFVNEDVTIFQMGYPNFLSWINGIDADMPGIAAVVYDNQLDYLLCPSDNAAPRNAVIAKAQGGNSGDFPLPCFYSSKQDFTITNYVINVGAVAVNPPFDNGAFHGLYGAIRSREAESVDEIPDGACNVVMFGEALGVITELGGTEVQIRHSMAMGGLTVGRSDLYGAPDLFGNLLSSADLQFGSAHPNTVSFVTCDGTIKAINRNIHPETLERMCGSADGLPFLGMNKK